MGKVKTKAYDKLYVIEKLVKIIEKDGEKFVVVKWKNFSDAQSTKEPLSYFAHMQACRDDLQKLEEEFEQRKYSNIVNIEEKANEYYQEYKASIFSLPNTKENQERTPSKEKRKEEIEQKVRCKKLAQAHLKKKIKYGLKQMEAEDYFYFVNLQHQCQERLKQMLRSMTIPRTNSALDEIKGLVKDNYTYLYYVSIASKVYTCSQAEMKEYFPQRFTKYLYDLTRYMKNYMSEEINAEEAILRNRAYRQQELYKATNVIKLKQDFEFDKNPVFFGLNEEDALQNKREENQRKLKIQTIMREDDNFCIVKSEQPTENVSAIEDFYADMMAQMNEMGIKMTVKTDKKWSSQNKGKFQSPKQKENITRKQSNSKDKSKKQSNAMQEQQPHNSRKSSIRVGRGSRGNSRSRGSSGRGSSSSRGNSKSQASSRGINNSGSKDKSNKKSSNQSRFEQSPASRSSDRLREKQQKKSKLKSKHRNEKAAEDPYNYDYSPRRTYVRAGEKNPRPSDPTPSKHQKKE